MILNFSVENWMSFLNRVSFSMIASAERRHGLRLPVLDKYRTKILPIAEIYGGNASGKTNFFKALSFTKKMVVKGTQPESSIPVEPFRLDDSSMDQPSRFSIELFTNEIIYEFSFAVTSKYVVEERLVEIRSSSEKVLYERHEDKISFDGSLEKEEFLKFAFQGTRDNQLFLTNSVSQKVDNFKPIYDWFKNDLELFAPDSRFEPFEQFLDEEHSLYAKMNEILPRLDIGIVCLGGENIAFESLPLPDSIKIKLQEDVKEGMTVKLLSVLGNERFVIAKKDGRLIAKKLVTYHSKPNGERMKFDPKQESDGSMRIIDLLPAFLEISANNSKKVYVIDEVDRSLHTIIARRLIEEYLASCDAHSRSQLIMTTHDVLLMDQHLLRRDEMWIAERNALGISNLLSFSEYKDVRYDKDIRKSYLQGRLGGIPKILLSAGSLKSSPTKKFG